MGDTAKQLIAERRRLLKEKVAGDNEDEVKDLSKKIQKEVRRSLRARKKEQIGRRLEEFRGLKEIADTRASRTKKRLQAVTNKKGENVTDRKGIVDVFADFYEALHAKAVEDGRGDGEGERTRMGREEKQKVSPVTAGEVGKQLTKMSKRKAADSSGIVVEMLQAGGTALREAIAELFTDVLHGEEDPASWRETRLKVLYKKGNP